MQNAQVTDRGSMSKYFSMMLHIDDDDLDPFEYKLLGHYRKVCGLNFKCVCTETLNETSIGARMCAKKVRSARASLAAKHCIEVSGDGNDGKPITVTLLDRMDENLERYARGGVANMLGVTPDLSAPADGKPTPTRIEEERKNLSLPKSANAASVAGDTLKLINHATRQISVESYPSLSEAQLDRRDGWTTIIANHAGDYAEYTPVAFSPSRLGEDRKVCPPPAAAAPAVERDKWYIWHYGSNTGYGAFDTREAAERWNTLEGMSAIIAGSQVGMRSRILSVDLLPPQKIAPPTAPEPARSAPLSAVKSDEGAIVVQEPIAPKSDASMPVLVSLPVAPLKTRWIAHMDDGRCHLVRDGNNISVTLCKVRLGTHGSPAANNETPMCEKCAKIGQASIDKRAAKSAPRETIATPLARAIAQHIQGIGDGEPTKLSGVLAQVIARVWRARLAIKRGVTVDAVSLTAAEYESIARSIPVFVEWYKRKGDGCSLPTSPVKLESWYAQMPPPDAKPSAPVDPMDALVPDLHDPTKRITLRERRAQLDEEARNAK